jgi:hypothetical protein
MHLIRHLMLMLALAAGAACQTDSRSDPPPGSRQKYDGGDPHKDRSARRSSGCCLQAPSDY